METILGGMSVDYDDQQQLRNLLLERVQAEHNLSIVLRDISNHSAVRTELANVLPEARFVVMVRNPQVGLVCIILKNATSSFPVAFV